jgi:hypothetical protein
VSYLGTGFKDCKEKPAGSKEKTTEKIGFLSRAKARRARKARRFFRLGLSFDRAVIQENQDPPLKGARISKGKRDTSPLRSSG